MPITSPAAYHAYFQQAFNAPDRAALIASYTPDATLMLGPGQVHNGHAAIGAVLDQFLAAKGTMILTTVFVLETGDTALTRANWTMQGTGPDGKPITMEGKSLEVLRRQPNGSWLVALDHPFGAI